MFSASHDSFWSILLLMIFFSTSTTHDQLLPSPTAIKILGSVSIFSTSHEFVLVVCFPDFPIFKRSFYKSIISSSPDKFFNVARFLKYSCCPSHKRSQWSILHQVLKIIIVLLSGVLFGTRALFESEGSLIRTRKTPIPEGSLIRTFGALFRRFVNPEIKRFIIPKVRYSKGSLISKLIGVRYSECTSIQKWKRIHYSVDSLIRKWKKVH